MTRACNWNISERLNVGRGGGGGGGGESNGGSLMNLTITLEQSTCHYVLKGALPCFNSLNNLRTK